MDNPIKYFLSLLIIVALLWSCTKNGAVINNIINNDSTLVGTTVTNGDTTIVTIGKLVITATKTSPCYPSTEVFTFKADASAIPNAVAYTWYYGDGNTDTGRIVQHGYNNAAPYVILLEVKNDSGVVINSATFPMKAWGQQLRPIAAFSTKNDFPDNLNYVTFNSASSVNHGSIVNYLWNWGDGTTSSIAVALTRHQFPTAPQDVNYPVKLTITTDAGCTADTTISVLVPATYPITGNFTAVSYNSCTNESIVFIPTATNVPSGAIYNWHFSDGTADTSGTPVQHSFAYMNDYDVIMYITLNGRTIYTTHKAVNAKGPNPKPTASFYYTWETVTASSVLISFNSQSTVQHGFIDGFQWDFGDGNTNDTYSSFVEDTYYKGTLPQTYDVRLIVTGNGCADTAYNSVSIPAK